MAFVAPAALPRARARARTAPRRRPHTGRAPRRRAAACAAPPHPPSLSSTLPHLPSGAPPALVHLVGTGPGDPGLLTLRAVHAVQTADVVLYDRLISPAVLRLIRPEATAIYVGKQAGLHTRPQEEIHALLAAFAAPGKAVVRLKAGDPFVFGRGGEEAAYLRARGIAVRVVPGVTAASGIAAALAVPLTHRAVASGVRFLTGHAREGHHVDVGQVRPDTTLVVYMGLAQLPALVTQFVAGGLPADTPALAVERGTTPEQRVVAAPMNELERWVRQADLQSPTLLIVGEVVRLGPVWEAAMQRHDRLVEGVDAFADGTWDDPCAGLEGLDLEKAMRVLGGA